MNSIYYDLLIYTIGPCVRHTVSPQVVRAGHCCHSVLSCSLLQHAVAPSTSTGTRRLFSRVRCVTRVCPWMDGWTRARKSRSWLSAETGQTVYGVWASASARTPG